jgi:hypothetical protein
MDLQIYTHNVGAGFARPNVAYRTEYRAGRPCPYDKQFGFQINNNPTTTEVI